MSFLRNALPLILFVFMGQFLVAQDTWSLERCIQYAQKNSLNVKQAEYGIQNALITEQQSKQARYPSVSGNVNGNLQFGRTVDPTTNAFDSQTIGSNSFSLSGSVLLYNGNAINNQIKQSKIDTEAAIADAQSVGNDLGLNIATAYLSALLSEEQLKNAQKQLELSQEQLKQTDRLIQAGSLPENDRLDILARIALDEQNVINFQNQLETNMLNLKQLMELDPETVFQIEKPEAIVPTDVDPSIWNLEAIYSQALKTQPQIVAGDLRLKSAELGVDIARSGYMPSVFLTGSLSTGYSSVAQTVDRFETILSDQTVFINEVPTDFMIEQDIPIFEDNPYSNQLNENFGQRVSLSIDIPIYSNYRNKAAVERSKVTILNTQVSNNQQKQQLKTNIQRAIADARNSKESLEASERSLEAAQMAFDNATKRFDLGAINTLEYATARNNLDQAENNLIISKYQYVFNLKVVDFYMGRPLKID